MSLALISGHFEPCEHRVQEKISIPFIDSRAVGVRGTGVYLRLLEELKAGLAKNQDVNDLVADYYTDHLPYQKKIDIFGMPLYRPAIQRN
jgi:hypothetical protein